MIPEPPPGQGPIDPRGAMSPPPPPDGAAAPMPNPSAYAAVPPPAGWGPAGPTAPLAPPPAGPMRPGPYLPGPPPRGTGLWKVLLIVILFIGLIFSVVLNIAMAVGAETAGGTNQTTLTPGNSSEEIAVLPLVGLIDDALEARMERYLNSATADGNLKAAIILIDTPGGSVTASDEIYKRLRRFKSEKGVPIVVAMRGMATSGGYYSACAADYLIAEPTTLTGNIGVLLPRFNMSKLMDKYGVEEDTIVSTGATYKDAGSMFRPPTPAEDAYFQEIADQAFAQFKAVVSEGRKGKLKNGTIGEIANGKAYTAKQALDLGLIDEIDENGYLDAAVAYATKAANLSKPKVVEYQEQPTLLERLSAAHFSGGGASGRGISLNLDASTLDRLSRPQAMYLYGGASAAAWAQAR